MFCFFEDIGNPPFLSLVPASIRCPCAFFTPADSPAMTHASDKYSTANSELEEALLLVSCQLDEALTRVESARLAELEVAWPKQVEAFRQQSLSLRKALRALPVRTVADSVSFVWTELANRGDEPTTVKSDRRGSYRLLTGILGTILCAGFLLALTQPWKDPDSLMVESNQARMESDSVPLHVPGAFSGEPASAFSMPLTSEEQIPDADAASPSFAESNEEFVKPLWESDNWNLVVVKVNGQNQDEAMDLIQKIVNRHGLHLQRSAGADQSQWLGVVLTSATSDSENVLAAMESVGGSQSGLPSGSMTDSTKVEIIDAVRESLRHPTRSELHHGKIFLALPTNNIEIPAKAGLRSLADRISEASPGMGAKNSTAPMNSTAPKSSRPAEVLGKMSPNSSAPVTLVMFEFDDVNPPSAGPSSPI